jgi:site-specific recombinase XerD
LNDGIIDPRHKAVFHTLRHTFASWLVQSGFPIALVSQMLGHSSINVTMRYAHLAPSQEHQAVEFIGKKLCGDRIMV